MAYDYHNKEHSNIFQPSNAYMLAFTDKRRINSEDE